MTIPMMALQLAQGLIKTAGIFFLTLLGALPLGFIIAFGRMSKFKPLQWITKVYISIMRGTPLILQIMVVYFGPYFLLHITVTGAYRFWAAVIAFIINYAAYFAEIYRSGIGSVPVGQWEAAQVMGYPKGKTFFRIILPQVIRNVLPSVTNEVITLVKDTSLASVISVIEMFKTAQQLVTSQSSLMPFVIAAVFYYIFNSIVAWGMERAEKAVSYFR